MKSWLDFRIDIPGNASGHVRALCPECSHQRRKKSVKCLAVDVDQGIWFCHHCGWSGTLKQGTQKRELHWQKPEFRKPDAIEQSALPSKVSLWFAGRGINESTLIRNKIHYGQVYMPQVEDYVSAIAFPCYRGGELVNIKWRDGQKNFRMEAGAERVLFGMDDIAGADTVIWVEGEIDKLSVDEAGFTNCVSVPDGAPAANTKNYSSKFDFVEQARPYLEGKRHVLFVDMDEPGRKLEEELIRRLGAENCLRVVPPFGCKDANEVLQKFGADNLRQCIEAAQPLPIAGVHDVNEMRAGVLTLRDAGVQRGVLTGWEDIDELYTVRPGEMTIVTGIPNSGKSNWLDALIVNIARENGWRFAMFSPENQPTEDHVSRMCEKFVGAPFFDGPTPRMSQTELSVAMDFLQDQFWWILPDAEDDWSLDSLLLKAKALVRRVGINGLVIDPWNEIDHARPQGLSETEYISQSLTKIRRFARGNNVHVWVVAHPAKLQKDASGKYPCPTPYDISGSAHWRNKADNCIAVYRHFQVEGEPPKPIEIHVQKIRFRHVGKIGMAELDYQKATATYKTFVPVSYNYREK